MKKILFFFINIICFNAFAGTIPSAAIWIGSLYSGGNITQFSLNRIDSSSTLAYGIAGDSNHYYVAGMGTFNGGNNYYASLWLGNSRIPLNKTDGSRANGVAVHNTNVYLVGPPDTTQFGNYTPQATLWIANSQGNLIYTNLLGPVNNSYAYGLCVGSNGNVYIAGYNQHPYLWITNASGQTQYSIQLSTSSTGASACTTDSSYCYVAGQDAYTQGSETFYLAGLWKTDLSGGNKVNIRLDNIPQNVDQNSYADACFLANGKLYAAGSVTNDTSAFGALWIYDTTSGAINVITYPNLPGAASIYVDNSYCYIVGGPTLWITDLNGKVLTQKNLDSANTLFGINMINGQIYVCGLAKDSSAGAVKRSINRQSNTRYQR